MARFLLTPIPRYQVSSTHLKSIYQAYLLSTNMDLLTCLLAVLSVVIASPVPDAELEFPSPLKGITVVGFGSYPPLSQNFGGDIASQGASDLGDNQDISTAWGNLAPVPQPDTLAHPMFDSTGNLRAQSFSQAENYGSRTSNTQTPFQTYLNAACAGTRSVCCSDTGIDADEQPGVPLPCSDSMHFFFYLSFLQKQHKDLFVTKENTKMTDAGFWPGEATPDRYCLRPVYLTDCNTVLVSFSFSFVSPLPSLFFLSFRKSFIIIIIIATTANSDLPYYYTLLDRVSNQSLFLRLPSSDIKLRWTNVYIHILVSFLQNNHFLRLLPVHRAAPRHVIFAPQKGMVMEERM